MQQQYVRITAVNPHDAYYDVCQIVGMVGLWAIDDSPRLAPGMPDWYSGTFTPAKPHCYYRHGLQFTFFAVQFTPVEG